MDREDINHSLVRGFLSKVRSEKFVWPAYTQTFMFILLRQIFKLTVSLASLCSVLYILTPITLSAIIYLPYHRNQVLGVHTVAGQQRWKLVYLNLLLDGVTRFSWKKMFMEYSRTKLWGNVWSEEVYVDSDGLLYFTVSIQHLTAHKISNLVCSVTAWM
jgi:hypothetical protein